MGVFLEQRAREDGKAGDGLTQPGKGGGDVSARNTGAPLRRDRAFLIVMTTINTNIYSSAYCCCITYVTTNIYSSDCCSCITDVSSNSSGVSFFCHRDPRSVANNSTR